MLSAEIENNRGILSHCIARGLFMNKVILDPTRLISLLLWKFNNFFGIVNNNFALVRTVN